MLADTIKRLETKIAINQIACVDCWHFDRRKRTITNWEGKEVVVMRGCTAYGDCHNGGRKSLWAPR